VPRPAGGTHQISTATDTPVSFSKLGAGIRSIAGYLSLIENRLYAGSMRELEQQQSPKTEGGQLAMSKYAVELIVDDELRKKPPH
jgi:hypothetical protein